jgi:tRNA nucleotidyltransferase/poly(A) polymerase
MELTKYQIYYVGGFVRDKLLGIKSNDIDFCFVCLDDHKNLSIEDGFQFMKEWLINEGFTIFLETPSMLTIRAKMPSKFLKLCEFMEYDGLTADFVLARKEISYDDNSRQPIVTLGTLEDDLIRRDFTVNAMAMDLDGNIIDLFGGIEDLNNKILKTPRDAKLTMMDDPLRILRALRFSVTKQFVIDPTIINAMMQQNIQDKLFTVVSQDRIREELTKMFKYSTSRTLRLIYKLDMIAPTTFMDRLFENGLWLKPTNEKIK